MTSESSLGTPRMARDIPFRVTTLAAFSLILSLGAATYAQDAAFDPGSDSGSVDSVDDFDMDSLFDDPDALYIEESVTVEHPEAALFEDQKFTWSGDFAGKAGVTAGYENLPPSLGDMDDPEESLIADLTARLWFDARPDRNYRVFGKFATAWPLAEIASFPDATSPTGTSSLTVPSLRVTELFTDFNWENRVFFRFGKQTSGWGLSRFYQIGDPLSVAAKDPEDPVADLEGPLALKVSVPLGVNALYFWSALKDSYLPTDGSAASLSDLGFGAKGDFLVPLPKNPLLSNGELSLGGWYQKRLAPRFVAGYSTGIGIVQVFSDQALTWGLDSARIADGETVAWDSDGAGALVDVAKTEKSGDGLYWSATLGAMYVNNDWHVTVYGEYLYVGAGSDDRDAYTLWLTRYAAENAGPNSLPATLSISDYYGYLTRHNSALSLSWSELFGNDSLSFGALWLQDWVDLSGMGNAKLTFSPFDHFALEGGVTLAWGNTGSEWVMKTGSRETGAPVRSACTLAVTLGNGKF